MKYGVGIIGCGNISGIYIENCGKLGGVHVAGLADVIPERAAAKAEETGNRAYGSVDELLRDEAVDIVLNLTVPLAHAEVALKAIAAGKHVYNEKPLGVTLAEGRSILDAAKSKGVRVGCAPDTFLGAGIQTCVGLIDEGAIGRPVAATAFMLCHGHESWHPAPAFYYQHGGGPMLDMGPYYVTALVAMLGPVKRLAGMTGKAFEERIATSEGARGLRMKVDVPTHVAGLLDFADSGAIATIVTSFDVWGADVPFIEVHGTEGSLSVPDPNGFGGPVRIRRAGSTGWEDVPLTHPYPQNSRGLGVADLAQSLDEGRTARASGELAYHVLEIMESLNGSGETQAFVNLGSTVSRPTPMPSARASF